MSRPIIPTSFLRSSARRLLLILAPLIPALFALPTALSAQDDTGGDLPVIEPRLTRILGSDTIQIYEAALSPDGRWVVFSRIRNEEGSLWVVSTEKGEPRRLLEASGVQEPSWSPDGTRIYYLARSESAVMVAPFDGRTGSVSGPPQRVTLEPAFMWYRLSPDGKWLAYRSRGPDPTGERLAIRVVPSSGGTARSVGDPAWQIALMDWSADGRYLYYRAQSQDTRGALRILRAPVAGGPGEEVKELPTGPSAPLSPLRIVPVEGDRAFSTAAGGGSVDTPLEVQRYDGRPVAKLALPRGALADQPGRTFTADGKRFLAIVSNGSTPLRILPVAGGPPRQLGEVRAEEFPWGWSADGGEVLFSTPLNGRMAIMRAPVEGGVAREVGPMPNRGPLPRSHWAFPITLSPDLNYLSYSRPTEGSTERTLIVRPVAGGEERVITRSLFDGSPVGPGGTPNIAGNDFLYLERRGEVVDLKATPPGGASRLLRSFPVTGANAPMGVYGTRVAFTGWEGDDAGAPRHPRLWVADGPGGDAKEVASVPGVEDFLDGAVWSPDGRWIASIAYVDTGDPDAYIRILLVGVGPNGEVATPARLIYTPIIWAAWSLSWLPDGSAVVLTGQSPPAGKFDIWLVPVGGQGRPVALTRDDPDGIGYSVLSPDGRYVAYEAFVERGSSLWLADLGDALQGFGR